MVLGTAQLGMPYGVANWIGQPTLEQSIEIVRAAWEAGVRVFDTARDYGQSEEILGIALNQLGIREAALVVTKLDPKADPRDGASVRRSVERSLKALQVPGVWGILLHREDWLDALDNGLADVMNDIKDCGLTRHVGVSTYREERIRQALSISCIDMIQAPCNAWDRRLAEKGLLSLAARNDKICFVRSMYLQGLLTLTPADVRKRLPIAGNLADRWHSLASRLHMSVITLAARYAIGLGVPIVVGAESVAQVKENLELFSLAALDENQADLLRRTLGDITSEIYNPGLWPRQIC